MALSDQRLIAKLREYLEQFARDWPFERLTQLGEAVHNEYEHDDDPSHPDFVQVHMQVLERDLKNGQEYTFAIVDISDNRKGFGKGSAYRVLCGELWVYANGNTEIYGPKDVQNEA